MAADRGRCGRFIPARAGNTRGPPPPGPPGSVHPRSRGEHVDARDGRHLIPGSSPLARGTRVAGCVEARGDRFIPARTGNTARTGRCRSRGSVHPRSRGEHSSARRGLVPRLGSSPLARGTPDGGGAGNQSVRFIPARAGNTPSPWCATRRTAVHPRSRGEHTLTQTGRQIPTGSSPLARGTRGRALHGLEPRRFIPARAGNTPCVRCRARRGPVHPRSRGEHQAGRGR